MLKKVLGSIICAVLIISSFSGCGKKGEDDHSLAAQGTKPVNIKIFMGQPEYTDAYNTLAAEYNKQFPNVKVDFEVIQSDYPTLLKTRIGSGNIPD